MDEAGLADGFSDELLVRFGISCQKAALTAQQDLAQIGIDIEVSTVDTATIVSRRNAREYSIMALPSSTPFDDPDGYWARFQCCLLYTSPSPRDRTRSRMPSSA